MDDWVGAGSWGVLRHWVAGEAGVGDGLRNGAVRVGGRKLASCAGILLDGRRDDREPKEGPEGEDQKAPWKGRGLDIKRSRNALKIYFKSV